MTREEKIDEIRQRDRKNYSLGYNCAECVTEAVFALVDTALPPPCRNARPASGAASGTLNGALMGRGSVYDPAVLPEGEDPKDAAQKSKSSNKGSPAPKGPSTRFRTGSSRNSIILFAGSLPENGSPSGSAANTPFSAL